MKFERLNRNSDFKRLYRRGKSCVLKSIVVYAMPNRLGINRIGITAGKKVGCAVERNRAKRRLRALWQSNLLKMKQGFDVCLVARGITGKTKFLFLEQDFLSACKTVGILDAENTVD